MKIILKNKAPKVAIGTLKPGDVFLNGAKWMLIIANNHDLVKAIDVGALTRSSGVAVESFNKESLAYTGTCELIIYSEINEF